MKRKSGKSRGGGWEERKSVIEVHLNLGIHEKDFFFLIMQNILRM